MRIRTETGPPNQPLPNWLPSVLTLLVAFHLLCSKPQEARVEAVDGDQIRTVALSLSSLGGKRDGASVNASLVFEGPEKRGRLVLELELDLGPPIRLARGGFVFRQSGKEISGAVDALSLDFQAGQSSGMSLGGRFALYSHSGTVLYRVYVPAKPFETTYR